VRDLSRALLLMLIWMGQALAASTELPRATDLKADAQASMLQAAPILILYSLPGCAACEVIRRSHLAPMLKDGKTRIIVRQIDLNSTQALKDFAGRSTTHGEFARAQGIRFAPIVKLVGPDGKELAEPLTGTLLPDFYAAYLDDAIGAARAKLKAAS